MKGYFMPQSNRLLNNFIQNELDRKGSLAPNFVKQCAKDLEVSTSKIKGVRGKLLCNGLHKPTSYVFSLVYPSDNELLAKEYVTAAFIKFIFEIASTR